MFFFVERNRNAFLFVDKEFCNAFVCENNVKAVFFVTRSALVVMKLISTRTRFLGWLLVPIRGIENLKNPTIIGRDVGF